MADVLNKLVDLVFSQPNVVIEILAAVAILCLTVAPVLALLVVGYALRTLGRREPKGGN